MRTSSAPSSVTPLATSGHYPVIFEDAGQLALSNAFIHVLLPLNLTKIRDELQQVKEVLQQSLESDHKLFTKDSYYDNLISITSNDNDNSSTFMSRLHQISSKFRHTVNLLPDSRGFHMDEALFLAHPNLMPLAPLRKKRNLAFLMPLLKEAVGTFWGLFGKSALSSLMSSVASGSRPPNVLLSLSRDQMTKASENVKRVISTIFKTQAVMTSSREFFRMYPVYAEAVNTIENDVTRVINVIQQLHNHRLSVDWLEEKEVRAIHKSILKFAQANNIFPITTAGSDYFQLDASYIRDGFDVTAILHVPCTKGSELLSLLRFVPAPIPIPHHNRAFHSIHSAITHDSNKTIVETFPEALFIKPEAEYIAIGSSSSYKLLNSDDLAACIKRNNIYVCDKPNFLKTKLSHSCVGAIYEKNRNAAMIHCQYEKRPFTESIIQIELATFIVFSPERFTARFSCRTSSSTADITAANRIYVAPDCTLQLQDHILLSSNHYTITGLTEIYDWDFNPLDAPVGRLLDNSEFFVSTEIPPESTTAVDHPKIPDTLLLSPYVIISIAATASLGALWPIYASCTFCYRKMVRCFLKKPKQPKANATQLLPPKPAPRIEATSDFRIYSNNHLCTPH